MWRSAHIPAYIAAFLAVLAFAFGMVAGGCGVQKTPHGWTCHGYSNGAITCVRR